MMLRGLPHVASWTIDYVNVTAFYCLNIVDLIQSSLKLTERLLLTSLRFELNSIFPQFVFIPPLDEDPGQLEQVKSSSVRKNNFHNGQKLYHCHWIEKEKTQ